MALCDDIRRMFHRWRLCFIPRMTDSLIHNGCPPEHVPLFTASSLDVPGDRQVDRTQWIDQMIC
jgi:hypothetical protein